MVFGLLRRPWRRDDTHDKQHAKKRSDASADSAASTIGRKARPLSSRWGGGLSTSHPRSVESKARTSIRPSSIGPGIASTAVPSPYLGAQPTPTPLAPIPALQPRPRSSQERTRAISEPKLWPSAAKASYPPRYLKAKDVIDPWAPTPDPSTMRARPHIGPPKPQPALPVPPKRPPRPTHLSDYQSVQYSYDHLHPPPHHGASRPRPLSMPPEALDNSLPASRPASTRSAPRPVTFHETHDDFRPPPPRLGTSPQPSAWRPQRLARDLLPPRQTSFPSSAPSSRSASPASFRHAATESMSAPGSPRFVTNAERPSRLRLSFTGESPSTAPGPALRASPLALPAALAPSGPPSGPPSLHLPPGAQPPSLEYTHMPKRAARLSEQQRGRPEHPPHGSTAPLRVPTRPVAESSRGRTHSSAQAQTPQGLTRRDVDVGRVLLPDQPPEYNPSWARDTDLGRPLKGGFI